MTCKTCHKEILKVKRIRTGELYCGAYCDVADNQRYVGESPQEAADRRLKHLRKIT